MYDVWLTIGLFDPCDDMQEPVAVFGNYHAKHDQERIAWLVNEYNSWAASEPDVYFIAAAFQAEPANDPRESSRS